MGMVVFAAAWESSGVTTSNFQISEKFPIFGKVVQMYEII